MRKLLLTGALTAAILIASARMAGAQTVIEYRKDNRGNSVTLSYSGWGFGGYGLNPFFPYPSTMSAYGGAAYYGIPYVRRTYYVYMNGSPAVYNYSPVYSSAPSSAERAAKARRQQDVEAGVERLKSADYRGALEAFRRGFVSDTDSGILQLYLGLALAGVGDVRNAERAFRGAFESLKPDEALGVNLPGLFRDSKEANRYVAGVDGSDLASGVVAFLMGRKDAARGRLEKVKTDPAARKLLDPLSK